MTGFRVRDLAPAAARAALHEHPQLPHAIQEISTHTGLDPEVVRTRIEESVFDALDVLGTRYVGEMSGTVGRMLELRERVHSIYERILTGGDPVADNALLRSTFEELHSTVNELADPQTWAKRQSPQEVASLLPAEPVSTSAAEPSVSTSVADEPVTGPPGSGLQAADGPAADAPAAPPSPPGPPGPPEPPGPPRVEVRLANAKERLSRSEQRHAEARDQLAQSQAATDAATRELSTAKADAATAARGYAEARPGEKVAPRRADTEARAKLADAERKHAALTKRLARHEGEAAAADQHRIEATNDVTQRQAEVDAAAARRQQRELRAQQRAAGGTAGEAARREWEAENRADQVATFGARSYEQLHHAIELQVLDEFPGVFTVAELIRDENIRLIPLELRPGEVELLQQARDTPRADWPKELADAVDVVEVPQADGSMLETFALKERGPRDRPTALHQGEIRTSWNDIYDRIHDHVGAEQAQGRMLPGSPEYLNYVRNEIIHGRDLLDWRFATFWGEAKRGAGLR